MGGTQSVVKTFPTTSTCSGGFDGDVEGARWCWVEEEEGHILSRSLQMVMVLMLRMVRGPDGEGGGASASLRRHLHPFPPQESPTLGKYIQILLFYVMP